MHPPQDTSIDEFNAHCAIYDDHYDPEPIEPPRYPKLRFDGTKLSAMLDAQDYAYARSWHTTSKCHVPCHNPKPINPDSLNYTREQAANALGLCIRAFDHLCADDREEVPRIRMGRRVLFPKEALRTWAHAKIQKTSQI